MDSEAALQWKMLALRLTWTRRPGEIVDAFSQTAIDDIEREERSPNLCLLAVIRKWTDMSRQHSLGSLYDVLVSMRLQAVADKLFEVFCQTQQ